jgi:hypothetical protein
MYNDACIQKLLFCGYYSAYDKDAKNKMKNRGGKSYLSNE